MKRELSAPERLVRLAIALPFVLVVPVVFAWSTGDPAGSFLFTTCSPVGLLLAIMLGLAIHRRTDRLIVTASLLCCIYMNLPAVLGFAGLAGMIEHPAFGRELLLKGAMVVWSIVTLVLLVLTFNGLQGWHEQLRASALTCKACGYDLRGNPGATACPECGEPVASGDVPNQESKDA